MRSAGRQVDWVSAGGFVVLAFAISWACFISLSALGLPFIVVGNSGMFGPAIAAIVVRLVRRLGLRGLGWWPLGRFRWYAAAYLIPPLAIVAGATLEWLTHYQRWHPDTSALVPATVPISPQLLLLLGIAQAVTLGVLTGLLSALGEELGWRGHLVPTLAPLGESTSAVIVGIVWGLWHLPVIAAFGLGSLTGLPGYGPKGWLIGPFFVLTTIPLSVVYSWLRFRSGSVWPCVLAHAMANGGLATWAILALSRPHSVFIGGPIGLLGVVPIWAVAVWLVATRHIRSVPDPAQGKVVSGQASL